MKEGTEYIDVIVPMAVAQVFSYAVPPAMRSLIRVGMRVVVPFGQRKLYSGLTYRLHQHPPTMGSFKEIVQIIDDEPIVLQPQLQLWEWLANYYLCSLGEVMRVALPAALKLESQTHVERIAAADGAESLTEAEQHLLLMLEHRSKGTTVAELTAQAGLRNPMAALRSLVERQLVSMAERIDDRYAPKLRPYVVVAPEHRSDDALHALMDALQRAPQQQKLLSTLLAGANPPGAARLPKDELLALANAPSAALSALVKRGALAIEHETVSRLAQHSYDCAPPAQLTPEQQEAMNSIEAAFCAQKTVLLHGVTSSGKTEVYIHLINKALERRQQVLYLLPEIALTAQIINRLRRVFGDRVGVYHSKYSDAERVEIYYGVMREQPAPNQPRYDVVLGVRSALFLPFHSLGLVIVDEEHESTYKQQSPSPRYHARDTAIVLAGIHRANVLLGSATPSVESYLNAQKGKYSLVELPSRHGGTALPEIRVVDTRRALRLKEMRSNLSTTLLEAIERALEAHEQVILFQNRRGFAPFIECAECGWIPRCTSCDVTLTYHKHGSSLICHYCGHHIPHPHSCMACGSTNLQLRGFGTERIEDDLATLVPQARVERLDFDSSRTRHAHERIVERFEQGEVDILVGTQMVAKGLDFDRVGLVGIVGADTMLSFPDFRAHERSFQLMEQVSGRAGRKHKRGLVIIQTSQPEHHIVQQVVAHDYASMCATQLAERREFLYPPYCRLVSIAIKHKEPNIAQQAALMLAQGLRSSLPLVLGPESPLVGRAHNLYIMEVLVKLDGQLPLQRAKGIIAYYATSLRRMSGMSGVIVSIDVDPV